MLSVGAGEVAVKFQIAEAWAGGVWGDAEAVVRRVTYVEFEGVGEVVLGLSLEVDDQREGVLLVEADCAGEVDGGREWLLFPGGSVGVDGDWSIEAEEARYGPAAGR